MLEVNGKMLEVNGRMLDHDSVRDEIVDLLHDVYYEVAFDEWCNRNGLPVEVVDKFFAEEYENN